MTNRTYPVGLIPAHIAKSIVDSVLLCDGDTWVLGNGRVAEYDEGTRSFIIHNRRSKDVLGTIPMAAVHEYARQIHGL